MNSMPLGPHFRAGLRAPHAPYLAIVSLCAALAVVQFSLLPVDIEDVYTTTFSTVATWRNILQGHNPFWLPDLGFGTPLPFRFHLFQHPLSFLVTLMRPPQAVQLIECVHLLIGGLAFYHLARLLRIGPAAATVAALSFLLSSSILQPFVTDEWPSALINEASLPVLVYGALRAITADDNGTRRIWTLATGLYAGVLVATTFPLAQATAAGIVAWAFVFVLPRERRLTGAKALAGIAAIAIVIGAGQLLSIWDQVQESRHIPRFDHPEPSRWLHLWSFFLRPFGAISWSDNWRVIYVGFPFGLAAVAALFVLPDREFRPIKLLFVLSAIVCLNIVSIPFGLMTNNWGFRGGVNFAALLLAGALISRLWATRPRAARAVLIVQVLAVVATAGWLVAREVAPHPGLARDLAAFHTSFSHAAADVGPTNEPHPRLLLTESFERLYPLDQRRHVGLIHNMAALRGDLAIVNTLMRGITLNAFWPDEALLEGRIISPQNITRHKDWLDVLGIRYVLASPKDVAAPELRLIRAFVNDGGPPRRLFRNEQALPLAVFVQRPVTVADLPLLTPCANSRALCRDWGFLKAWQTGETVQIDRSGGSIDLTFPASSRERFIFMSVYAAPAWRIQTAGAALISGTFPFIGLRVEPNVTHVALRYRPTARTLSFSVSVAAEILAFIAVLGLLWGFGRYHPPTTANAAP